MTPPPQSTSWQAEVLAGGVPVEVAARRRDPIGWPGYTPRLSVTVHRLPTAVAAVWDFSAYGGSFGEDDATALVAAAELARSTRLPLLTLVRSGGTRLQEGMAALVGIPRARLALHALAAAGVPHLSVADSPTTGGVWISVVAGADLRLAVAGATVGFAGPRVVEAVTGTLPGPGSHTARSAYDAGLVDAVLPGDDVPGWVARVLLALTPSPAPVPAPPAVAAPADGGWAQVSRSRRGRSHGHDLLNRLLTDAVPLRAPRGDATVSAVLGRAAGRPAVGVALAARTGQRPTPDGYRLAARAYALADRLALPVLSLVDTPGAEPGTAAEDDGVAPAMGAALDALLLCRSPTVALVHGEGGSGGALAAAAADVLLVTPDSWFAAIAPEGASAALRRPVQECAELLRLTPADLLALGAADALVTPEGALWHLDALAGRDPAERLAARRARWAAPLPGTLR